MAFTLTQAQRLQTSAIIDTELFASNLYGSNAWMVIGTRERFVGFEAILTRINEALASHGLQASYVDNRYKLLKVVAVAQVVEVEDDYVQCLDAAGWLAA